MEAECQVTINAETSANNSETRYEELINKYKSDADIIIYI